MKCESEKGGAYLVRLATMSDVAGIYELLQYYAEQGLLLPRSKQSICEHLMNFRVVEENGVIVGMAALHILGDDLAEIRSLAVHPSAQGKGYGHQLVADFLDVAEQLQVPKVLVLTYQEPFFQHCAFEVIEKSSLRQKIWKDCIHCKKFPVCDEIAMVHVSTFTKPVDERSEAGINNVPITPTSENKAGTEKAQPKT